MAYYLHGLSGTEIDWLSKGSIDAVADSLFARGMQENEHRRAGEANRALHAELTRLGIRHEYAE